MVIDIPPAICTWELPYTDSSSLSWLVNEISQRLSFQIHCFWGPQLPRQQRAGIFLWVHKKKICPLQLIVFENLFENCYATKTMNQLKVRCLRSWLLWNWSTVICCHQKDFINISYCFLFANVILNLKSIIIYSDDINI